MRLARRLAVLVVLPLLALTFAARPSAALDEVTKKEIEEYAALVQSYYKNPAPKEALAKFMRIDWGPYLLGLHVSKRQNFNKVASAFFTRLVLLDPSLAQPLADQAAARGMKYHILVVARAIALTGAPDRDAALETLRKAYDSAPGSNPVGDVPTDAIFSTLMAAAPTDDLYRPIALPVDLDIMWAGFYASGDKAFVEKIVGLLQAWLPADRFKQRVEQLRDAAQAQEGPERDELRLRLTAQAAAVSLRANAIAHERVRQVLENLSLDRNSLSGAVAKKILESLGK